MNEINFTSHQITYRLKDKTKIRIWLHQVAKLEGYSIEDLNYIFCSDTYELELNLKYLQHNTLTDVITFDNSGIPQIIIGDIFISTERIAANAKTFKVSVTDELHRVMVHGLLHLCGYKDKSKSTKTKMTEREDFHLKRRKF